MRKERRNTKKYSLGVVVLIGVLALFIGASGMYWLLNDQLNALQKTNKSLAKISTVYQAISDNYYQDVKANKLTDSAIEGMVKSLDDQYSEYLDKQATKNLNETISSSFVGIGVEVTKDDQGVKITAITPNSPAQTADLQKGDIILKIDGKKIDNKSLNQVTKLIKGKANTEVKMTFKRQDKILTKTLMRKEINVATVNGFIDSNDKQVGYIQITSFSKRTTQEFKTMIKKLRKSGAKKWIIDVRDNPGGLLDQALNLSSMFLKDGKTIMQIEDKQGQKQVYKAQAKYDKGFKIFEPTTVLINGNSASAAEIFAGALKQSAHVKLVGTKSFGKGTVQTTIPFKDQTELKLTIAKWLTPKENWIHHKGLQPDITANSTVFTTQGVINDNYQLGDESLQVGILQKILADLGYTVTVNGTFDETTKNVVAQFQQENKLQENGKITQTTLNVILAKYRLLKDTAYQKAINLLK